MAARTEGDGSTVADPLSIQLVRELRHRIITGVYQQGVRLPEQRLASDLNVSRIPLREALPQLEVEGFVISTPRRGIAVHRWTPRAVDDLFDTRLAIEPYAARLAARRSDSGTPRRLSDLLAASERERERGDALRLWEANADFHQGVVDLAGNDLLSGLMRTITPRMTWVFHLTAWRDPHLAGAEHGAITEAVARGDEQLAASLMFAHIEAGREPTLASLTDLLATSAD